MGIFIIGAIICVALMYFALERRFNHWLKGILALLSFASLTAVMFFFMSDPFCVSEEPNLVDTYELVSLKEGDEIYSDEKTIIIQGNEIKFDVKYNFPYELQETVNLLLDTQNDKLYYLMEDKVVVIPTTNVANTNYEDIHYYEAEVISGDYEELYVEKYEQKTKMTFLSMGIFTKTQYKFYIPEESVNQ